MSHSPSMKNTAKVLALASVAALIPKVSAHGFVSGVNGPNGAYWQGFDETTFNDNKAKGSPILIGDYGIPRYDVWSSQIACGINPQAAQSIAPVSAGDKIWWNWHTHNGAPWTHNEGTHRSFIAPCNGDCGQVDVTQLEWTELSADYTGQQGWDGNKWPVQVLANNQPWSDTIPPAPNGDYIIRNELTALHFSNLHYYDYDPGQEHGGGIEFYLSCMAIRISNSNGSWDMSRAVKFPGAYTVDEPGHYNPTWTDPDTVGIAATNTFARTVWPSGSGNSNPSSNNNNNNNNNSGNNNGNTPGNTPSSTASAAAVAPTIQNPICNKRRKRSLSPALGRRHHQARRLTGPAH